MKRIRRLTLIALTAFIAASAIAAAPTKVPAEGWLGLYMGQQKMGYMHLGVDKASYEGKDCLKVSNFVRTKLVLLGANVQQDIETIVFTDQHFTPYYEKFEMASGGRKTVVEATFSPSEVRCKLVTDAGQSDKIVPIPEGATLVGDSMYVLGESKLAVGQKAKMHYFNPLSLTIDPLEVEVMRKEKVEVKGKSYDTYVVKNSTPMGDMTSWQTEDGGIVKVLAVMGMTMQIESAAEAVSGVDTGYMPPADLAVVTSVKANIDIPNARKLKKLQMKLIGKLDPKMAISDTRQQVKWLDPVGENQVADFVITAQDFNPKDSAKLPLEGDEFKQNLGPSPYLETDSPEIRERSSQIVGRTKLAYQAASKIRRWVSQNMKPQADIGIVRPATDVLRAKVGVCRDYAILYAALARAAGIPTKVVAGVVYMDGSFYYHAWAESYVGQWIAFDPTLKTDFVDATHIKLTEGDATNMFELARVFGNLKAEVGKFE